MVQFRSVGLDEGNITVNRTDRLLAIILELQAKGQQRAEDLATTFEISKRTIYRDIQALSESGVPVIASPGHGYSLMEGYFLPPLQFSADEAVILLLGADFLAQSFDDQYRAAARSAMSKIEAALPEKSRDEVRELQNSMQFVTLTPSEQNLHPDILMQIRRAIIQRRRIHFDYHTRHTGETAGRKTARDADPYALAFIHGHWYLTAYCHLRQDVRNFRLERIDHLTILNQRFQRPADFRVGETGNEPNIPIRALFSKEIARWVLEEHLYYMVSEEETPEGLLVTFKVRQENELLHWLLGWGGHVRVLEPEGLRQRLIEAAEAFLLNHKLPESLLT
jgi:predicted DNA-binding transcriptional regulator YafY